ncbi:putative reverse transcriptase zinc-binding domain-containing protein [Helianthus annuus]|nr:putative reverse transcriptase zinc-binding domain-containing protein [Helianthus annuus]
MVNKEFKNCSVDLNDHFVAEVDDGKTVRFWVNCWVNGGRLSMRFPDLYRLSQSKQATVEECYSVRDGVARWELKWKRGLSSDQERAREQRLQSVLIHLSRRDKKDTWSWLSDKKKTDFPVKIVRQELEKSSANTCQNNIFNWNRIAVPKINHFVWRATESRIPTATALARRNVNVGNERCPLCGIAEEDAHHLLVACSFARSVWWSVLVWVKLPIPRAFESVNQVLQHVQNYGSDGLRKRVVQSIALLTLWIILTCRNEKIFKPF